MGIVMIAMTVTAGWLWQWGPAVTGPTLSKAAGPTAVAARAPATPPRAAPVSEPAAAAVPAPAAPLLPERPPSEPAPALLKARPPVSPLPLITAPATARGAEPAALAAVPVEHTPPAKPLAPPTAAIQPHPGEVAPARDAAPPRAKKPDPAVGLFRLGVLYQQAGEHQRAVEQYRTLLADDPRHVPALNNLAVSLRHLGELEEAADLLRRATTLDPTYDVAFTNLGVVRQLQERPDAAMEAHLRALAVNARNWESAFNLGLLFLEADELERASQFLLKVVSLRPHASAYYHLGLIAERQARHGDAHHRYRQALQEREGATAELRAEVEGRLLSLGGEARR